MDNDDERLRAALDAGWRRWKRDGGTHDSHLALLQGEVDRAVRRCGTMARIAEHDLRSAAWAGAWEALECFQPDRGVPLLAWVRLHLRYRTRDAMRRFDDRAIPTAPDLMGLLAEAQTAAEAQRAGEDIDVLEATRQLPALQQRLIIGTLIGLRPAELRQQLDLSRDAYSGQRRRALTSLRGDLQRQRARAQLPA